MPPAATLFPDDALSGTKDTGSIIARSTSGGGAGGDGQPQSAHKIYGYTVLGVLGVFLLVFLITTLGRMWLDSKTAPKPPTDTTSRATSSSIPLTTLTPPSALQSDPLHAQASTNGGAGPTNPATLPIPLISRTTSNPTTDFQPRGLLRSLSEPVPAAFTAPPPAKQKHKPRSRGITMPQCAVVAYHMRDPNRVRGPGVTGPGGDGGSGGGGPSGGGVARSANAQRAQEYDEVWARGLKGTYRPHGAERGPAGGS